MENTEQSLFLHYTELLLHAKTTEEVQEAENHLTLFSNDLNNFNELQNAAITNPNPVLRKSALLFMDKMIFKNIEAFDSDSLNMIKTTMVQILQGEGNDDLRCFASTIGVKLAQLLKEQGGFPELFTCGQQYMESIQTYASGLYLWTNLIEYECVDQEQFNVLLPSLVEAILASLQSQDSLLRIRSISLLSTILVTNWADDLISSNPILLEAIQAEAQISMNSDDVNESLQYFGLIVLITKCFTKSITPILQYLYQFTLECLKNEEMDTLKRNYCLQFFVFLAKVDPDAFEEDCDQIIDIVFSLMYSSMAEDPENYQILFIEQFFLNFAKSEYYTDMVFIRFTELANEMIQQGNTVGFACALSCIAYTADSTQEIIMDHLEDLMQLINTAISTDDSLVYTRFCELIQKLMFYIPQSLDNCLEDLCNYFLLHLSHQETLITLDALIMNCERPINNIVSIIDSLIQYINVSNAESILPCITSSILNIGRIEESLYAAIREHLINYLNNNIARSKVFECFSFCVTLAPQALANDLPDIFEVMYKDLQNLNEPETVKEIAGAVGSITKTLAITVTPYATQFYEYFSTFFANEYQNEDNESRAMDIAKGEALKCLSILMSHYPEALQSQYPVLSGWITSWLKNEDNLFVSFGADCVNQLSGCLSMFEGEADSFIQLLTSRLENIDEDEDEDDSINAIFNSLSSIFIDNGETVSNESIEKANAFYTECLNGNITCITNANSVLDPVFYPNVGYSLQSFILGGAFVRCQNGYTTTQALIEQIKNKNKAMKSYAIMALTRICFVTRNEEIPYTIIPHIFSALQSGKLEYRALNSNYASIMFLLNIYPSLFDGEKLNFIKTRIESEIMDAETHPMIKETISVVWLILFAQFNIQPSDEVLSMILDLMPPGVDDEGIPMFSSALWTLCSTNQEVFGPHIHRFVSVIAASSNWCLKYIPQEQLAHWFQIVKEIPNDTLITLLKQNEVYLLSFNKHINV